MNGKQQRIESGDEIPSTLVPFISLVNQWAITDQSDQDDYVEAQLEIDPAGAKEFARKMESIRSDINEWKSSLIPSKYIDVASLADDALHPYWAFIDALKVSELIPLDDAAEQAAAERTADEIRRLRFADVIGEAEEHFRRKNFEKVVGLLADFEDLLSTSQRSKLNIARKRL